MTSTNKKVSCDISNKNIDNKHKKKEMSYLDKLISKLPYDEHYEWSSTMAGIFTKPTKFQCPTIC